MRKIIISSYGECSNFRYAGIGRQLLPKNPLKEIFKQGLFFKILIHRPTDQRTDRPSYRDARKHLKMFLLFNIVAQFFMNCLSENFNSNDSDNNDKGIHQFYCHDDQNGLYNAKDLKKNTIAVLPIP